MGSHFASKSTGARSQSARAKIFAEGEIPVWGKLVEKDKEQRINRVKSIYSLFLSKYPKQNCCCKQDKANDKFGQSDTAGIVFCFLSAFKGCFKSVDEMILFAKVNKIAK